MPTHSLDPIRLSLHGVVSRELEPVLRVASGDTVRFKTLDADWWEFEQSDPFGDLKRFEPRTERDRGHCLVGPVYVEGAKPGGVLEIRINQVRPGRWGSSGAGGFPSFVNKRLGLADGEHVNWRWKLDPDKGIGVNQHGLSLRLRPFMGVMGLAPAEPGDHPTPPPRACGGNIDCKELVAGSVLYLPVMVEGGLFSLGDGHAVQGDGEVASPALECPMELVEVELHARPDLNFKLPRALSPAGWITFGFDEDLDEALCIALDGMLHLLGELKGMSRKEALAYASLCVDMRVTQVVNGIKGCHALLPAGAIPD